MPIDINAIEKHVGGKLPSAYREILEASKCGFYGDSILIYSSDDVIERNTTFEVTQYCPGYIAIGDDSGGIAIVISLDIEDGSVYCVDQGSMDVCDFRVVSNSLKDWLSLGCPVN